MVQSLKIEEEEETKDSVEQSTQANIAIEEQSQLSKLVVEETKEPSINKSVKDSLLEADDLNHGLGNDDENKRAEIGKLPVMNKANFAHL